jgi:DNA-binding transcriptional regulator YiaG
VNFSSNQKSKIVTRHSSIHIFSPRTLQNREQCHHRPEGAARDLLRVAESHPEAVLEALHRWAIFKSKE